VGKIIVLGDDRPGLEAIVAWWLARVATLKLTRGGSQAARYLSAIKTQIPAAILKGPIGRLWFCAWFIYIYPGDTCGGVLCPRRPSFSAATIECGRVYLSAIHDIMVDTIESHCDVSVAVAKLQMQTMTTYHAVAAVCDVNRSKPSVGLRVAAGRVDADDDGVAHDGGWCGE
jgi:hypothetical protein